jgi:hypothetical protein
MDALEWLPTLGKLLRSSEMPQLTSLRFDSKDPRTPELLVGDPIIANEHYFGLTLNQLCLSKGRQWWTTFDPLVYVNVGFVHGAQRVSVSKLVGPSALRGKLAATEDGVPHGFLQSDIRVMGPHPYRGGPVDVTVVLYAVKRTDYAKKLIALAEGLSSTFGIGAMVMPFLKMGDALVDAVDATFQLGDSVPVLGHQLGLTAAPRTLRTQYVGLISGNLPPRSEVHVVDNKLQLPAGIDAASDYVLYNVWSETTSPPEATSWLAPSVRKMEEFTVHGGDPGWDRAKSLLMSMYLDMRASPDLLKADADRLFSEFKRSLQELREVRPGLLGGSNPVRSTQLIEAARELDAITHDILSM